MGEARDEAIENLVAGARGGDPEAFAGLVHKTARSVFAAAARIVGDAAMADDIAQETFFRAWKNISILQTPAAFGGWVRTIAMRLAFDELRLRSKFSFLPDGLPDRAAPDNPERQAAESERRRRVMEEVARLDREFADAVALVDLEGMSYEDAAETLHIGINLLKVRLHRARKMLRDRFVHQGILKSEDA